LVPEYTDTTVLLNSIIAALGQLLNQHSNAPIHNYTNTEQLPDKGRESLVIIVM
jgi:hypothetical protein